MSEHVFRWLCVSNHTLVTIIGQISANITSPHSWQQFKEGFGPMSWPPTAFMFCGLEYMHMLTSQGVYDMSVFFSAFTYPNGRLWYRNIRVDSEANGYSLHWDYLQIDEVYVNSYQYLDGFGGAGDATKNLNGARFGTFDNDVSGCAHDNHAGWWYNPLGCTSLKFEEAGLSWPTNRSGTVETELLFGVFIAIHPVVWYIEDDLVL